MATSRLSPLPFNLLEFSLPHTVEVAILVYGYGLTRASTDFGFSLTLVREVDADATILILQIDEGNVVILSHGMRHRTYFHLDATIVQAGYHGEVLLYTGINGVHGELLHLLATTYDGNLRVYNLLYYITAMLAFEKSY